MVSDPPEPVMPPPPDEHLALGGEAAAELRVQRSRFIGLCAPARAHAAAQETIARLVAPYHDARHACWAWRLGAPPAVVENRNDDGEPSGTAGEPILAEIRKRDLTDAVVVVVRYFGGVKLGTGGLARAYGQAAAAALAAAPVRRVRQGREFTLNFPYGQQKTLTHLLTDCAGTVEDEQYAADVAWRVWLPHSRWPEFLSRVREATAGAVVPQPGD